MAYFRRTGTGLRQRQTRAGDATGGDATGTSARGTGWVYKAPAKSGCLPVVVTGLVTCGRGRVILYASGIRLGGRRVRCDVQEAKRARGQWAASSRSGEQGRLGASRGE